MISLVFLLAIVMPPLLPHPLTSMQDGFNQAIQDGKTQGFNATKDNSTLVATLKNVTGISALQNSTISCLPGLLTGTHTTSHTTKHKGTTTTSTLSTGTTTVTPTKPVKSTKTSDYLIGLAFGRHDGRISIYDPPGSCGEPQGVKNQTACGEGYKVGYVKACTALRPVNCGDGPSTLSPTQPTF